MTKMITSLASRYITDRTKFVQIYCKRALFGTTCFSLPMSWVWMPFGTMDAASEIVPIADWYGKWYVKCASTGLYLHIRHMDLHIHWYDIYLIFRLYAILKIISTYDNLYTTVILLLWTLLFVIQSPHIITSSVSPNSPSLTPCVRSCQLDRRSLLFFPSCRWLSGRPLSPLSFSSFLRGSSCVLFSPTLIDNIITTARDIHHHSI